MALRGLTLALLLLPAAATAQQKRVLILHSSGNDSALADVADRLLPRLLDQGLSQRLDFYSENIDAGRFPTPQYQAALAGFLKEKYRDEEPAMVIAFREPAIAFLQAFRHQLFPNAAIVYFTRNPDTPRLPNSTGIVAPFDFGKTVELARSLQPDLKEVFVISGASRRDAAFERAARVQLRPFEPALKFTYLTGLTTEALEERLSMLPEQSIVYYLQISEDGNGRYYRPADYLDRIAALSTRPIYSWVDWTVGRGVVGGNMQEQVRQVEAIATVVLRMAGGESADNIPVASAALNVDRVDSRQLNRWGMSETRLPPGTEVVFREPTAWQQYRVVILVVGGVMLGQTLLIGGFLFQSAKRRHAEREVHRKGVELKTSSARIQDLGKRLLHAQETERSRIARELHDDVGQQVALLAIDLELLSGLQRSPKGEVEALTREVLARTQDVAKSVHDLSHRLHPAKLRLIGLVPALNSMQRELTSTDLSIVFTHRDVPATLPYDLSLCLFRVVQEALQNVIKHSGARNVAVDLAPSDSMMRLTIVDDGVGFDHDTAVGRGLGLVSMRERMESAGGALTIRSHPAGGTRLEGVVPMPAPEAQPSVAV